MKHINRRMVVEIIIALAVLCCLAPSARAVEEKEEPEKPQVPYSLSIEAKYLVDNLNDIIDVKGTADLPDGALMYVFFKRLESFIASREVPVKNRQFSVRFGPFERQISAGGYTVEADFIAYRQPENIVKMMQEKQGGKKIESFNVSVALTVVKQNTGKADLTEEQVKKKLLTVIFELEGLYEELEKARLSHKGSYDKDAWEWSNSWSLELTKIRNQLREVSGNSIPLFPRPQQEIDNAAQNLSILRGMYLFEAKDPVKFAEASKNPGANGGPELYKKFFQEMLKRAKDGLGSK